MKPDRRLLVATTNPAKGREIVELVRDQLPTVETLTLADLPSQEPPAETGRTFAENARIKANWAVSRFGLTSIADDGGLIIDALGGLPGVQSHRFLGDATAFVDKMAAILDMMKDVPDDRRQCRFECAVAIITREGRVYECAGACSGYVAHEIRGSHGFGYDPIFIVPELGRHMAELPPEQKHRISHRGRAMAAAAPVLQAILDGNAS